MPDQTPNHGFDVNYQDGEAWDYNAEFNDLEERVPIRDVESNRSNLTPHANAIFIATDSGAIYEGDGSSWNKAGRQLSSLKVDSEPTDPTDVARLSDIGSGTFSPTDWDIVDASENGYPGDGTGGDISNLFAQARDNYSHVKVVLPGGDYSVGSEFTATGTQVEGMAIVAKQHATLTPADDTFERVFGIGDMDGNDCPDRFALKNVDIDITGSLDCGVGRFNANKVLDIENVQLVGQRDRVNYTGDLYTVLAQMTHQDGIGRVNVRLPDGNVYDGYDGANCIGGSADPGHLGTLLWEGCHIEEFYDNGLYVNNSEGSNHVIGGLYRNNGRSNVRLGKSDTGQDFVSVYDISDTDLPSNWDSQSAPDLLDVDNSNGSTVVNGAKIWNFTNTNQPITVRSNAASVTFRDLEVVNTTGYEILRATSEPATDADDDYRHRPHFGGKSLVRIEGGSFYDNPDASVENRAFISRRPNVSLEGVTYHCDSGSAESFRTFMGADESGQIRARDCVVLNDAPDGAVINGADATGAVMLHETYAEAAYLTHSDPCEYLTVRDNDLRNVGALWYSNDPSSWATDARVAGNWGYMSTDMTV